MGYILAAIMVIALIGLIVVAGMRRAPAGTPSADHLDQHAEPAADEPTPGASDTADPNTVASAQRRVPPA